VPVCRECAELKLGVPGVGAGKRCKWLIVKPLEPENPRVGGSIPPLATIQIRSLRRSLDRPTGRCFHLVSMFGLLRVIRRQFRDATATLLKCLKGSPMESFSESKTKILAEITADDPAVRASYLSRYSSQVEDFAMRMAAAVQSWRELDAGSGPDEERAYVSALVYCAITLHIQSMRLFLSGHIIAAGNLSRQVVESIALSLLCSKKELGFLKRSLADEYSPNLAVRDVVRSARKLGLRQDGVDVLKSAQTFFHKYSHPTKLTLAAITAFSGEGLYVGASFDEGKVAQYDQEMSGRVSLANVFSNFVAGVRINVDKWKS
jgi:hypothetical protein